MRVTFDTSTLVKVEQMHESARVFRETNAREQTRPDDKGRGPPFAGHLLSIN